MEKTTTFTTTAAAVYEGDRETLARIAYSASIYSWEIKSIFNGSVAWLTADSLPYSIRDMRKDLATLSDAFGSRQTTGNFNLCSNARVAYFAECAQIGFRRMAEALKSGSDIDESLAVYDFVAQTIGKLIL